VDDIDPAVPHVWANDAGAESEPFGEGQRPGSLGDEPVGARLDEEAPGTIDPAERSDGRVEMLGPDVPTEPRVGLEERQVDRPRAPVTRVDQPVGRGQAGDASAHHRHAQGPAHAAILGRAPRATI
jgi:hypothetical protein